MSRFVAPLLAVVVLTLACSSRHSAGDDGQTTTTQGASESGEPNETSTSTSTTVPGESEETAETDTTDTTDATDEAEGFVPEWDVSICSIDELGVCDELHQDCPEGEKCVPHIGACAYPRCVPITGDKPAGEPCTADEMSGDDCDADSWCYPGTLDLELPGVCIGFCQIQLAELVCADPTQVCMSDQVAYEGVLGCRPSCDPLVPEACEAWERCTIVFPDQQQFGCVIGGGVATGEVCSTNQNCDSGACVPAEELLECAGDHCCSPWCDLLAPSCAIGLECVPVEIDDPGSTVGVCALP